MLGGTKTSVAHAFKREELKVAGHTPEDVNAAFTETEPGSSDQISYGAGDKNLVRTANWRGFTAATMAAAQPIARAGPSNVARNPSPAVSTS